MVIQDKVRWKCEGLNRRQHLLFLRIIKDLDVLLVHLLDACWVAVD